MKKNQYFLLLTLVLFFLYGCIDETPSESLVETPLESTVETQIETPVETSLEMIDNTLMTISQSTLEHIDTTDGFTFDLFAMRSISSIKDKYFFVHFKAIHYQPITNQVCIIFDYDDEDYERATYYMIGREKGSLLTAQQLSYTVSNPSGEHGGCFSFMNEETTYEILIGKVDRDDLNPTTHMEAVAVIEFIDHNYDERNKIGLATLTFEPAIYFTYDQAPSITLDVTIEDPHQTIDQVELRLLERDSDKLLETYVLPVEQLKWIQQTLVIEDYVITNLAPHVDYRIKVYVDGFNGIESFSNIMVQNQYFTSQGITNGDGYRRHGFFAEIIRIEPGESEATLYFIANNDHMTTSEIDQAPYDFVLNIYDFESQLVFSQTLDVTKRSMMIPQGFAEIGYLVEIVTDRDDITLHAMLIEAPAPRLTLHEINQGFIYGQITYGLDQINFVTLFILKDPLTSHMDEAEIISFDSEGTFEFNLQNFNAYRTYDRVLVLYQINYGPMDDIKFSDGYAWIEIK